MPVGERVPVVGDALQAVVEPLLVEDSPAVLSLGYRCAERGCDVHWKAFAPEPIFLDARGVPVEVSVDNYVPYLE